MAYYLNGSASRALFLLPPTLIQSFVRGAIEIEQRLPPAADMQLSMVAAARGILAIFGCS